MEGEGARAEVRDDVRDDVRADVVVIGAGPAGLRAAVDAARRGFTVELLEAGPVPGGLAASFEIAGVRVDHGSHRLHRACPPEFLDELRVRLGADLQRRVRNGRLRIGGRWVRFPPRPADLVRRLPPGLAARLARDLVTGPVRRPRRDTFAEVVRAGLGPTMYEDFYGPYVQKIWGRTGEDLAGELARRRVSAASGRALVSRLRRPDPDAATFWYPRRGFGQIVETLADAAVDAGVRIRTGCRVEVVADGRVLAPGLQLDAPVVLSTIPLPRLVAVAQPAPPVAVRDAADSLEYRGLVLCYLVVAGAAWTDFDAHYVPGPECLASRVSEPKRYRDGRGADPPDLTVLCAEIPATVGDDRWTAEPGALAAQLLEEFGRLDLPVPQLLDAEVRRVPNAYPVYTRDYARAVTVVDRWASARPGVVTLGRQGLFAHDNTHHAFLMGRAAAECLRSGGGFDAAAWAAARDGFAAHVVED